MLFQFQTLVTATVLDVTSDIFITSIPVCFLWHIKIPWRRKAALMGLLSLTALIMVFAIIRVAIVARPDRNEDITWLWLWSFIDDAVGKSSQLS